MHSHLAGTPLRGKFNGVVLLKMPVLFINHGAKEAALPPPTPPILLHSKFRGVFKVCLAFFKASGLRIHEAEGGREEASGCILAQLGS